MGQNPIGFGVHYGGSKLPAPFQGDSPTALSASPGLAFAGIGGIANLLNITAPAVVKALPGRLIRVSVLVAGTAPGSVYDCATTAAAGATNRIALVPTTVGFFILEWPCLVGIVVVPGAGQVLAVSFS